MATNKNDDGDISITFGIIVCFIGLILNPTVIYYGRKKISYIMDPVLNESRRKNILTLFLYKTIIM